MSVVERVTEEEMFAFLTGWIEEYDYAYEAWTRRALDRDGAFRPDVAHGIASENARKRDITQAIIDKLG